jgi:hypothetical protein
VRLPSLSRLPRRGSSLRLARRPRNQSLGCAPKPPAVDELGQRGGCGRTSLPTKRSERGEYRLPFVEVDVANFAAVAPMPADSRAAEPLGLVVAEEEA